MEITAEIAQRIVEEDKSAKHELKRISNEIREKASIGCSWVKIEIHERHQKTVIDALNNAGFEATNLGDNKFNVCWYKQT